MAYAVAYKNNVMATDVQSLNRTAVASADIENGSVFLLNAGQESGSDRYTAVQPTTGNLSGLWMALTPEVVEIRTTSGKVYKGIDPDPRDFINYTGQSIDAVLLQKGDVVTLTSDAMTNAIGANTFAVAQNANYKLLWATAAISGLSLKLVETTYTVIASGQPSVLASRVTSYKFEVVAN